MYYRHWIWMALPLLAWPVFASTTQPAAPVADGLIGTGEYRFNYLHAPSRIILHWTVLGDTIYLAVESPSRGWTGIGFGPTAPGKFDADMYQWVVKGDQITLLDSVMTNSRGVPKTDTVVGGRDDVIAAAGSTRGAGTIAEFSRKLDTGDKADQVIVLGRPTPMLVAFGATSRFTVNRDPRTSWRTSVTFK